MESQFSKASEIASSLLGLVPAVCCSTEVNLDDSLMKYEEDLPSPELFPAEFRRWKRQFMEQPQEERPASPAQAIKVCDNNMFPNLSILVQIACTLPVTSRACERSASALRRQQNYMRTTMAKDRLSGLALMHIHYDSDVNNMEHVVDLFAKLRPRRLELNSLLTP